ncbi:MAG: hypothetical protein ACERK6_10975 [Candidatus Aminicenantaceae bacterium]
MREEKSNKDRLLTGIVVAVSVAGILYFGIRAITEKTHEKGDNPFVYDIESYKQSGADLVRYSEVQKIPIPLTLVYAIAVGPEDALFVSGDESVLVFDSEARHRSTIAVSGKAWCLAVDGNGDLYAGMHDHVKVFDREGALKSVWASLGEEAILTSISLGSDSVFVADAGQRIVWGFDKTGGEPRRIGARDDDRDIPGFVIPSPYFDVAVDPDGFLWAANTGRHSLENYTPDGALRSSWGEFSMEIEGFCGCCNPSHFAILEDGSFVTSEKGIPRVKIYDRLGRLASVVAGSDRFDEGTVGLDLALDSAQRILVLDPARRAVRIFVKDAE